MFQVEMQQLSQNGGIVNVFAPEWHSRGQRFDTAYLHHQRIIRTGSNRERVRIYPLFGLHQHMKRAALSITIGPLLLCILPSFMICTRILYITEENTAAKLAGSSPRKPGTSTGQHQRTGRARHAGQQGGKTRGYPPPGKRARSRKLRAPCVKEVYRLLYASMPRASRSIARSKSFCLRT